VRDGNWRSHESAGDKAAGADSESGMRGSCHVGCRGPSDVSRFRLGGRWRRVKLCDGGLCSSNGLGSSGIRAVGCIAYELAEWITKIKGL
jgi:hypothetical protein